MGEEIIAKKNISCCAKSAGSIIVLNIFVRERRTVRNRRVLKESVHFLSNWMTLSNSIAKGSLSKSMISSNLGEKGDSSKLMGGKVLSLSNTMGNGLSSSSEASPSERSRESNSVGGEEMMSGIPNWKGV